MAQNATRQSNTVDFVISCSICQDTLSTVYADLDGNGGLRKDGNHTNGSITKLWLTECAHITCGKHLEGGGVPFYPENQPPKAPCPFCVVNNGDESTKILYGIRGTLRGQYDESIPAEYLQVPAPQLGGPGNEALRFQFVSLLRFATKVHERLFVAEKDSNTWKERESTIVACLAAQELLGRALQLARDQLSNLGEETSFIDDVLHQAAGPRGGAILPTGQPASTVASSETPLGDQNLPAGSLLARGSAADLRIIQNDVLSRHDRRSPRMNLTNHHDDYCSSKRIRLNTANETVSQRSYIVDSDLIQQQLSSRDVMPPPPKRVQAVTSGMSSRPASFRRKQYVDPSPSRPGHCGPTEDYVCITTPANYTRTNMFSENLSRDGFGSTGEAPVNHIREQRVDDRKVDYNSRLSSLGSRQPGRSPNRLTLPSSTPSIVSRATPGRVGMIANARTSKSVSSNPGGSRPSNNMAKYSGPANGHGPSASPYFGSRQLPANHAVPSLLIHPLRFSAGRQTVSNNHSANTPVLAPTPSIPWRPLSWLSAPFKQDQQQSQTQPQSIIEEAQGSSGAYRQPCTRHHLKDQRLSLNSFSFTNQPQIESLGRRDSSRNIFAEHGRRAAHR